MPESFDYENKLLFYWLKNLVGTRALFTFNLTIHLSAGLIYSFKILPSPHLLLLFGVISPILFTLCLYTIIRNGSGYLLDEPIPNAFVSRSGNLLLMTFDICLIVGFALLIYFGPLNYFLFRFVQTIFFPCTMLVLLRVLLISQRIGSNEDENDVMK